MAEILREDSNKISNLITYAKGLVNEEKGIDLYNKYKKDIESVGPREILSVIHTIFEDIENLASLKKATNKFINVVSKSLLRYDIPKPDKNSYLDLLMKENQELVKRLDELKPVIKSLNQNLDKNIITIIRQKTKDLQKFDSHYVKKENTLFPLLEKIWKEYKCLNLMWSFHDDIRQNIKDILRELDNKMPDKKILNNLFGSLFFNTNAVKFREERIIYPVALYSVTDDEWEDLLKEGMEIGFAYINVENLKQKKESVEDADYNIEKDGYLDFGTGLLSLSQAKTIFNHLPFDITFINENDEVRYFNNTKEKIFTRSKSVIGRNVRNCHPPESLHIVEKILEDFKARKKDKEVFWIDYRGKFVYIEYFAVRNDDGDYMGTIEISRDVSDIKKLQGEKRLLS